MLNNDDIIYYKFVLWLEAPMRSHPPFNWVLYKCTEIASPSKKEQIPQGPDIVISAA